MMTHTLINHGDIQKWVLGQNGQPALSRVPDYSGRMHSQLVISFARQRGRLITETPNQDDGAGPCSWTAWLAELDRQHLALRVTDDAYEFVDRHKLD